jgi:diadenylate cyclase
VFPYIRLQDIADIIIMTFLVYQLYSWFKNTRALQVVMGLGFLGLLYVVTKNAGLFMTSWILQELGTVLFVLIIVVFQGEIRQALYRFSLLRNLFGRQAGEHGLDLMELASTGFSLAAKRTGAIIVFQRQERLDDYLLHGVPLDSLVSGQLLVSIFEDGTPLHDGAVVIRDGRIDQASCHLPLSASTDLPQHFGTRHRAALGLTERSDAVVVVVSEERGEVSLAVAGKLQKMHTSEELAEQLQTLLVQLQPRPGHVSLRTQLFRNLVPKLATLLLVVVSWLIITAKQGGLVTVTAPIKFHNLPESLALKNAVPEEVEVQLTALSSLVPTPGRLDITVDLDLAKIHEGANHLAVDASDFHLPLGVSVASVTPARVKVVAERKVQRELPVRIRKRGVLSPAVRLRRLQVEPGVVTVAGPEHLVARLEAVETEEVDLALLRQGTTLDVKLVPPAPQVQIRFDGPVRVRALVAAR